jgi:HD-GYP domain-containing protein (c-di-GMP phosphodiesterase class II)
MTSNRLYRDPVPIRVALQEVERCAGSQFDPQVVSAFLATIGGTAAVAAS